MLELIYLENFWCGIYHVRVREQFGSLTDVCGDLVDFRLLFGGHVVLLKPVRVGFDTHLLGGFCDSEVYVSAIYNSWE